MSKMMLMIVLAIVAIVLGGCAGTDYESSNRSSRGSSSGHAH